MEESKGGPEQCHSSSVSKTMADTTEPSEIPLECEGCTEKLSLCEDLNQNLLLDSLPDSSTSLKNGQDSKDGIGGKPIIHLLGGSYVLDLNFSEKISRKIARREEKERRKLHKCTNTPTSFDLNPTVGNWRDCSSGFTSNFDDDFMREGLSVVVAITTMVSMLAYLGDVVSDLVTTYMLYANGHRIWSVVSLVITVVPIVAVNIVSLIWYHEDKLYHGQGWILRLLSHVCFCGVICRHVDILVHGYYANREKKTVSIFGSHYSLLYVEQRRITATLTLIECFLQDAPQFSLQVYIWTVQNRESTRVLWENLHVTQFLSIAFSLSTLCYSIVSFHQALRFAKRHVIPMNFLGCIAQFIWRVGTTGSRILAIMFALTAFPIITTALVILHWVFMVLWLKQQSTSTLFHINPCISKVSEAFFEILMAGVHIFCYLNLFENRIGYRLVFFYGLELLEDSVFILLWYSEMLLGLSNYQPWIYHAGIVIYLNAFVLGLVAMMIFYAKLHPNMVMVGMDEPVMPRSTFIPQDFLVNFKSNFQLPSLRWSMKKDVSNEVFQPASIDDFQFHIDDDDTVQTETAPLSKY